MHLFGDSSGPHLAHFHARRERDHVELFWEVRNAPALRWRVLRSEHDYVETADALPDSGQTVVMEGTDTHLEDDSVVAGTPYFYTVFAQDEQGAWHLQVKTRLAHGDRLCWLHPDREQHELAAEDYRRTGVVLMGPSGTNVLLERPLPLGEVMPFAAPDPTSRPQGGERG